MAKTWLITGGRGFIGTNLRIDIKARFPKDQVFVVDNFTYDTGYNEDLIQTTHFAYDVADYYRMKEVFLNTRPDYVVHLAANTEVRKSIERPRSCFEENVLGTLNCLDLSKEFKVEKVIVASSCSVAGNQLRAIDETSDFRPESPYAASKVCAEVICESYLKLGVKVIILRFSNLFGPWSIHKNSLIPKFIKSYIDGKVFTVYGDGNQKRNFVYIKDATGAIIKAVKSNKVGVFCIADYLSYSVNEFVEIFNEQNGARIVCEKANRMEGEVENIKVDNIKSILQLYYQYKYSLADGISETYKWYKENYTNAD